MHTYCNWTDRGKLLNFAERETLSEGEARKYFRQLIHGMNYCHKLLLVHRDVKPAILLLDETKQYLKIADFGISNYLIDDLTLSTNCGTDFYQAPEGIGNDILLETVNKMKCDREDLIQSLIKGKHTEETTTYKVLKKKMRAIEDR